MRKFFIAFLVFAITAHASRLNAQQVFKTTPSSVIGYLEYLPADYHTNSDKYPVVIFLHGIGERGVDSTDPAAIETTIYNVAKIGPPQHVKTGTAFPFILISPQLKINYGTWPSWYVLEVINHVKTYLRIDERRIHVSGLSLGGGGAWVAAQDYPRLFASVSPVCGGYNSPSKACGMAAENLPVWAFHGDKDTIVPLSKSTTMINAINACTPAPSPLAKLDIYAGVAHDAWVKAYAPNHNYHNPNVYDWIMSHTNTLTAGNGIPVANAGSDKSVGAGTPSVALAGSALDKENAIASYRWTKLSGPSATLSGTSSGTLTVNTPASGTYVFRLQVTDNAGNTDSDYVKLTVSNNTSPTANAGPDKIVTLPTNTVSIQGSGTDSNGSITSYSWAKLSGGNISLSGQTTPTLGVSGMTAGTYLFRLTVTDNQGATHIDDVKVTVNTPPNVFAGKDYSITLPTNSVSIPGSSSDVDGTIVSYTWQMLKGAGATLSGTSTSILSASGMNEGTYIFRFTVKDNLGAIRFDDIQITVLSPATSNVAANAIPLANAGADKVIHLPTNTVSITGSGTDTDGSIVSYAWMKLSGGTVTLSNASSATLSLSNLVAGSYLFRLTVKDNAGATDIDDVKVIVNNPPVVSAGADVKVTLPTNSVKLTGVASDSDGTISSYQWTMIGGTTGTLLNAATSTLTASGLVAGSYAFRLTVKDNYGATRFDDVAVTVQNSTSTTAYLDAETQQINPYSDVKFDLAKNEDFWSDKSVTIFDGSGKEVFDGQWKPHYYGEIESGMYVVTVYVNGKRVHAEKIYKLM